MGKTQIKWDLMQAGCETQSVWHDLSVTFSLRDFVVYVRHERLTAMYPKFMENPKYFDKKNVMYQQNYADYSPGFDWKRYLPWNFTDELRDMFVSKDFLKRCSESQNGRFAKSLRQLG